MKYVSFENLDFLEIFKFYYPLTHSIYWAPYPWYFDPPTHGILTTLTMVYWPPYPWYIDPLTHGISTPPTMVYWPPYPWYIDPPTHGILTPLPMVYRPPIHGILTPLPIDIRPPTHDILASLPISWLEMGGSKCHGGSIYHTGEGSVFNKGAQYTLDENWPRGQFTMGFKIPYDTGSIWDPRFQRQHNAIVVSEPSKTNTSTCQIKIIWLAFLNSI